MALQGLLGRLLAPSWTFASGGLTSDVFALARRALRDALSERLGQEGAKDVYHEFATSLVEAVGATVHMRLCIHQTLQRYYVQGNASDNFQLRKTLVSFSDMRFKHRFTGLLMRLGVWSDRAMVTAVATMCALHETRRGHKVPEYLLKAHEWAMDRHYLSHMLCSFPAADKLPYPPQGHTTDETLPQALLAWLPEDIPQDVRQRMASIGGYVHEEHKEAEEAEGEVVAGRFAPNRVCLWNLCDDDSSVEVKWLRTVLRDPVECTDCPPEGLAHVVVVICAPESALDAINVAQSMSDCVCEGTQTLTVLMVAPATSDPVDSMQPCLRYTDQLGLCLTEGLRQRGLFNTRVHLEMIWATGSNAPVQTLLRDGDEWWRYHAEHAANRMVGRVISARCGPWTAGLHVALPGSFQAGIRHDLLSLVNDASLCRIALTSEFQPYHTVVVLSSMSSAAERTAFRSRHLAKHYGRVVWLVILPDADACATCPASDPDVATLCGVPTGGAALNLPELLTKPCNVAAMRTLRHALGGVDD